ncbi:MAG: insulinase family protein, partial [candidate division WOR-3 bacterium]
RRERQAPLFAPLDNDHRVLVRERRENSQVYVSLAVPAFPFADSRRCALGVLGAAFGGATSSRLFQRLRENEGFLYSVWTGAELFSDTGLFEIHLNTDRKKLPRALEIVRAEWDRLRKHGIDSNEFRTAVSYTKGNLVLSHESLMARMMRLAGGQLLLGRPLPLEEQIAQLGALETSHLDAVLEQFNKAEGFYVGAAGPITEEELRALL